MRVDVFKRGLNFTERAVHVAAIFTYLLVDALAPNNEYFQRGTSSQRNTQHAASIIPHGTKGYVFPFRMDSAFINN